jgi:hypothetical protein
MRIKFFYVFSYITIFLTACLFGLLLYWSVFPLRVSEVTNQPMPILNENKTVKIGGTLQHLTNYCKYINGTAETTKQFVNGLVFSTPAFLTDNPEGCHQIISQTVVPKELMPGTYRLRIIKIYHLNPIRDYSITVETEPFTVTQ